ncbi:oxygen-independent coproporphyrinogen-III oxidase-like protein [Spirochaetota bacterium]|nr:oxygen-independent coproporphyrinogen-III oxidase-like protein [Spirochaetota bacterium]
MHPPLGIYVHIPFCRHACAYCDFYFTLTATRDAAIFIDALINEAQARRYFFAALPSSLSTDNKLPDHKLIKPRIKTLYLGGGTPSLLTASLMEKLLTALKSIFSLTYLTEVTLEVNPEDISEQKLRAWHHLGITRLSLGVQSFNSRHAKYLGRKIIPYPPQYWERVGALIRNIGFSELSLDLMYGFPSLSISEWRSNLNSALALGVDHISLYSLTLEKNTRLHTQILKGSKPPLSEQQSLEHFLAAKDVLNRHGFIHYEISNFAKPGHMAKHNQIYWTGGAYLGLGPSAHSYDGGRIRSSVASNLKQYLSVYSKNPSATTQSIDSIDSMTPMTAASISAKYSILIDKTVLTTKELYNDFIITRLRSMLTGIALDEVEKLFSMTKREELLARAKPLLAERLLALKTTDVIYKECAAAVPSTDKRTIENPNSNSNRTNLRLVLTAQGSLVADAVMRQLMDD